MLAVVLTSPFPLEHLHLAVLEESFTFHLVGAKTLVQTTLFVPTSTLLHPRVIPRSNPLGSLHIPRPITQGLDLLDLQETFLQSYPGLLGYSDDLLVPIVVLSTTTSSLIAPGVALLGDLTNAALVVASFFQASSTKITCSLMKLELSTEDRLLSRNVLCHLDLTILGYEEHHHTPLEEF